MITKSLVSKESIDTLRADVLRQLVLAGKSFNVKFSKELFLASFPAGIFTTLRTINAMSGASGIIAVGFSSLKKGMVDGYFGLEIKNRNGKTPKSIRVIDGNGALIREVRLQYEITPPPSAAREIRIESFQEIEPEKYMIDGSIKMDDGWHKFKMVLF